MSQVKSESRDIHIGVLGVLLIVFVCFIWFGMAREFPGPTEALRRIEIHILFGLGTILASVIMVFLEMISSPYPKLRKGEVFEEIADLKKRISMLEEAGGPKLDSKTNAEGRAMGEEVRDSGQRSDDGT